MPDQSNGQRLWALVHRGPQASAILFPRCLKRSILRLKPKITSFSVLIRLAFQADGKLFLGVGLWQSNVQKAAVVALDVSNGNTLWTTFMPGSTRCVNHHNDF